MVNPSDRVGRQIFKVGRANDHLETLKRDIRQTLNGHGDGIVNFLTTEFDEQTRRKSWTVTDVGRILLAFDTPITMRWAALVGDFIHNLRSALDISVCGLVKRPKLWHAFPICNEEKDWKSRVELRRKLLRRSRRTHSPLENVPPKKVAIIQEAQPYKTGDDLLTNLGWLSNVDKHRAMLQIAAWSTPFPPVLKGITQKDFVSSKPLRQNTKILTITIPREMDPKEVDVERSDLIQILFTKRHISVEALERMLAEVTTITKDLIFSA